MGRIFDFLGNKNNNGLNPDVFRLYNKYKQDCQIYFGTDINDMSGFDDNKKYYVYAWHTKSNPKMYFYVGKGTGNRYNHILRETDTVVEYKLLQDKYGIDYEILLDGLSEKEALVYEFCVKKEMTDSGEVILDNEGISTQSIDDETKTLIERQKPGARIEADLFIDRYLHHKYKLEFDSVKKDFLKITYFYPYSFTDNLESIKKRELATSYILGIGGKINKSLTKKTQSVIIQGRLPEKKFISLKETGKKVYDIDRVLDSD